MWAEARPGISPSGASTTSVTTGNTTVWNLADTLVVNITFDSPRSWVVASVSSKPATEKARLLKHEQGHYEIVALLARDMFIEMMQLKNAEKATSNEIVTDLRGILSRYQGIAQPLQDLYDSTAETDHGRNATKQTQWNRYLHTAFTQTRNPAMNAPDGTSYKTPLLDVLSSNGITI